VGNRVGDLELETIVANQVVEASVQTCPHPGDSPALVEARNLIPVKQRFLPSLVQPFEPE